MSLIYEFGEFQLDSGQRLLRADAGGRVVDLTPRVFDILLYFVEHRGELVSKNELLKAIWPNRVVEESNLSTAIYTLRNALGERADEHRFIVTVPGRGYRFVAEVGTRTPQQSGSDPKPGTSSESLQAAPMPKQPDRKVSHWVFVLAGVVVAAALLVWIVLRFIPQRSTSESSIVVSAPAAVAPASLTAVAVLPFANLTGDPSQDYFGDGIAEELINTLSHVPGLKVPARTSSFAYKGKIADSRQIARELDVRYVVEGSVRRADQQLRISARLIDAQTGFNLWEQSFDREFKDLFAVQGELAVSIVDALQQRLEVSADSVVRPPPTQDVEAYRLWLQGSGVFSQPTEQNVRRAIELLRQAVGRDPDFASAWLTLAFAYGQSIIYGYEMPGVMSGFRYAADQASKAAPESPEDFWALAYLNLQRGRWVTSESYFRSSFALADYPEGRTGHAIDMLMSVGYAQAATEEMLAAYKRAPQDVSVVLATALLHSVLGRDDEAVQYAQRLVELGFPEELVPLQAIHAFAELKAGHYTEAGRHAARAIPQRTLAEGNAQLAVTVYEGMGNPRRRAEALAAASRIEALATPDHLDSYLIRAWAMGWYTQLDDVDRAFAAADKWVAQYEKTGFVGLPMVATLWKPELRPFRRDPRFARFVSGLNLTEYWQRFGPPDGCTLNSGKLTCS